MAKSLPPALAGGGGRGWRWQAEEGEAGADRQRRARLALAGGGGPGWRGPAGAATRGGEERMRWGLRTLAVRRGLREESATHSCEEGQRGGAAKSGRRLDDTVYSLYLSLY